MGIRESLWRVRLSHRCTPATEAPIFCIGLPIFGVCGGATDGRASNLGEEEAPPTYFLAHRCEGCGSERMGREGVECSTRITITLNYCSGCIEGNPWGYSWDQEWMMRAFIMERLDRDVVYIESGAILETDHRDTFNDRDIEGRCGPVGEDNKENT